MPQAAFHGSAQRPRQRFASAIVVQVETSIVPSMPNRTGSASHFQNVAGASTWMPRNGFKIKRSLSPVMIAMHSPASAVANTHPAGVVDIELGDQLAGDQDRGRDSAADLVRVLPLRDCDRLPVHICRRATRGCVSTTIGLAAGCSIGRSPDGGLRGLDRQLSHHPPPRASIRARVFNTDLGRSARGLAVARTGFERRSVRSRAWTTRRPGNRSPCCPRGRSEAGARLCHARSGRRLMGRFNRHRARASFHGHHARPTGATEPKEIHSLAVRALEEVKALVRPHASSSRGEPDRALARRSGSRHHEWSPMPGVAILAR